MPQVHESEALLLRRVELAEADLIVTLFTRTLGRVSALARGARRSRKRFGGALEPFFTLHVRMEERPRSELFVLSEASVVRPRLGLLSHLSRLEVAGRALSWVRRAAPPRTPEPEAWALLERLLDRLTSTEGELSAERELCELGLPLLAAFGWGIDLERCVSCGKPCPDGAPASVDAARGGLVCRECGGGRMRLSGALRERLARAARGEAQALDAQDVSVALDLIDRVFAAHAGLE
ncbi:MAG TPA: DNA repair protein RecO [Polyangiaceae bacterium]|nr:DNA repair protein RecO [Polyangiaceae bacterium]